MKIDTILRRFSIYLLVHVYILHAVSASIESSCNADYLISKSPTNGRKVIILDIDNCVYSESEIKASISSSQSNFLSIEEQIIQNTHEFGKRELNLTKTECDDMYLEHGSTVEGIRQKLMAKANDDVINGREVSWTKEKIDSVLHDYYQKVYDGIDMTCLLPSSSSASLNTGYNHAKSKIQLEVVRNLLHGLSHSHKIYLASNSPQKHVMKVLSTLGLKNIQYDGILTPDTVVYECKDALTYPTKFHPEQFFHSLLSQYNAEDLVLIDDSSNNLRKAREVGIEGVRVNGDHGKRLEEALSIVSGHIESSVFNTKKEDSYEFSDVAYLQSKNVVDMKAINPKVWTKMLENLFELVRNKNERVIRVADVGAGLLSMLELFISGGPNGKKSILEYMDKGMELNYIAYESNKNLLDGCKTMLKSLGFKNTSSKKGYEEEEYSFARSRNGIKVNVSLRMRDFSDNILKDEECPDLIVGCCFADLFEPNELVSSLMKFSRFNAYGGGIDEIAESTKKDILIYFPITFAGTTQFFPPSPFGISAEGKTIPSDTIAFQLYADSLIREHHHNLDPNEIIRAMKSTGAKLIDNASSVWRIDPNEDAYLWQTLLYFFGNSAASQILNKKWDSTGWINRAKLLRPKINVMNQDLLFQLPPAQEESRFSTSASSIDNATNEVEEIEFRAPNVVGKSVKPAKKLGPNQVEGKKGDFNNLPLIFTSLLTCIFSLTNTSVKSICSLISSGTELKIFKGLFDEAQLDVNIKGMEDETMKYPLSYGYSLVGIVTRCGEEVKDANEIIGKMVFTFSPHANYAVTDRDGIQLVPDDIEAEDAIFMPSVETALSIAHDANVRVGEKVAVYGQGLIGLLVNGILNQQQSNLISGEFGTITVFDTISERLSKASEMGSAQALLPQDSSVAGPFDVSIEVSGNFRALQSAIDNTRNGGRIIGKLIKISSPSGMILIHANLFFFADFSLKLEVGMAMPTSI